ncbi:hypothetical protein DSM112329_02718 [Paraconexibacter sp. AEG42_29]|uniref:DUF222 domain-containing protein n=1 Tax=Paraconexibacter sp. AEG42_29 TaxID=2997339 RepID=A0AAU7AW31_9ACTN
MDGSPQAAVTPEGVRDGDPAVLAALVARRGPAVLAFCDAVCEPDVLSHAIAEAFARFRALVATVSDLGDSDPDAFLLGATRHAAASMARVPNDSRGVFRVLGRGASPETYAAVPGLLAARADSMLGADDLERLSRLLEKSAAAREVEAAFRRAERGYRSPPARPIGPERTAHVIAAMQAAAPIAEPFATQLAEQAPAALPDPESSSAGHAAAPGASSAGPDTGAADRDDGEPASDARVPSSLTPADAPDAGATALHPVVPASPEPEPEQDLHEPYEDEDEYDDALADDEPGLPEDDAPLDEDRHAVIVPPGDPVLAELEAGGVPVESPTRVYRARRGLPRVSLPSGGGRSIPRRAEEVATADAGAAADHGPVYRLLLPAVAILIAVLVMLAIAGVFGGGDPAPAMVLKPAIATQLPPDDTAPTPPPRTTTTTTTTTPTPATKKKSQRPSTTTEQPPPATSTTVARTNGDDAAPSPSAALPTGPASATRSVGTPAARTATPPAAPTVARPPTSSTVDDDYRPYDPSRQPAYGP